MDKHSTGEAIFTQDPSSIRKAAAAGTLLWKGKKAIVDPFTPVELVLYLDMTSPSRLEVIPYARIGDKERSLALFDGVFPSCLIDHNLVRFFSEKIGSKWLKEQAIQGEEIPAFLKTIIFPVVWRRKPSNDSVPVLSLTDRTGAFADLWMDGGIFGRRKVSFPLSPEEQAWEKDLLQTDFIRKPSLSSQYYCPMDKIGKSLTFLLEVGWEIIDVKGRRVYRQAASDFNAHMEGDRFSLRGKIQYGEHTREVQDVFGAFNRREKFLELSPHAVGLIEMPPTWEELAAEAVVEDSGVSIPKTRFALLEEVVRLPEEYRRVSWEACLPASGFKGVLYPYQQKGVDWLSFLYRSGFHGLLADEMGLGKTVQLLAFFSTLSFEKPILIVMPSSLLFNWRRECEKFLPDLPIYTHAGPDRSLSIQSSLILTSYAILRQDRLLLEQISFEAVILDEAQTIKNPDSLAAQAAYRLKAKFRLAITGTPIENRYEDLWSIFRFTMPDLLGDRRQAPVLEVVRKKITPFLLRRTKEEVGIDLPSRQEQIVWVELSQEERSLYDRFLASQRAGLIQKVSHEGVGKNRLEILEAILRLRQMACHPKLVSGEYEGPASKLERLLADLEEVVSSGQKVLVYSQFTAMLKMIEKELIQKGYRYLYLDGQTENREEIVTQFQSDPAVSIFLISLKAGGVGLNLTEADYVFLYDPWWNEAVERQAIDRAHRIGRNRPVIARRYLACETIEEKILKLKGHKVAFASTLLSVSEEPTLDDWYSLLT